MKQWDIAVVLLFRYGSPVVRLVLFDIDGTLIQTGGAGVKAFERVFATEFGVPEATRSISFAGRTDPSIVREFFHQRGLEPSAANFDRFFDRYLYWLDYFVHHLPGRALPGVQELIAGFNALPQPPLMGLLTGNVRLGAEIKLRQYQLWEQFEVGAFGSDHEDRNQLGPIARERAARRLNKPVTGDEVLVIGDTPLDIACARAFDAKCLAVATGSTTRSDLATHQPTWAVDSLAGLDARELVR